VTLLTLSVAVLATWFMIVAQQTPGVPFITTTSIASFSFSSGATLYFHRLDGSYAQAQFGLSSPYKLASAAAAMAGVLSDGLSNIFASQAGPANVGRSSQIAAFGVFGASTPGVAYVDVVRNRDKVTVYSGSLGAVFSSSTSYTVGPETSGVVTGDFNRDGRLDLAVPYYGGFNPPSNGGVGILLGNADGTFQASVSYPAGKAVSAAAAFDVNKDNILDLIVPDQQSKLVYVLLGKGDGTFNAGISYATAGQGPNAVTVADFNGDGNPDLATTSFDATASVLLGNGDGTFRAGSSFATGNSPRYLAAGDFDKDGKLDLVVAAGLDQTVTLYRGAGNGTFTTLSAYGVSYLPESLIVTDFDGDGNLDIINGTGDARGFGAAFDSGNIDILLGKGNGTFDGAASISFPNVNNVTSMAVGDFNGDGRPDIALQSFPQINYALGNSLGGFQNPTKLDTNSLTPNFVAAGDFNGDGRADLAVTLGSSAGNLGIALSNGNGFSPMTTQTTDGGTPSGIVPADFDGDGKLDLAVTNRTGTLVIFKGAGNGTFAHTNTYPTGGKPTRLTAGDLNGDGKLDLVIADNGDFGSSSAGGVVIFLGDGTGKFQGTASLAAGKYPIASAIVDVNRDGKVDLVVSTRSDTSGWKIAVLLGNGSGGFGAATLYNTDFGSGPIAVADFDGDKFADIVVTHCCGSTDMTILRGNGDGTFRPEVHFNGGASPADILAMDMNGDGGLDLLIAGNGGSVTALMNRIGSFFNANGATFDATQPIAQDSIVTAKGSQLATTVDSRGSNLPLELGGTTVTVVDAKGSVRLSQLFYVSPSQVNYVLPAGTVAGNATVKIRASDGTTTSGPLRVVPVGPGIIQLNTLGLGAFTILRVLNGGALASESVYQVGSIGGTPAAVALPIDLGPAGDNLFLSGYGTGFRYAKTVTVTINGLNMPNVAWAASPQYPGVDQVNIGPLPRTLIGKGSVDVVVTADGIPSNVTNLTFR
jgi:uncharacterized protein (TIGR03437 family)